MNWKRLEWWFYDLLVAGLLLFIMIFLALMVARGGAVAREHAQEGNTQTAVISEARATVQPDQQTVVFTWKTNIPITNDSVRGCLPSIAVYPPRDPNTWRTEHSVTVTGFMANTNYAGCEVQGIYLQNGVWKVVEYIVPPFQTAYLAPAPAPIAAGPIKLRLTWLDSEMKYLRTQTGFVELWRRNAQGALEREARERVLRGWATFTDWKPERQRQYEVRFLALDDQAVHVGYVTYHVPFGQLLVQSENTVSLTPDGRMARYRVESEYEIPLQGGTQVKAQ